MMKTLRLLVPLLAVWSALVSPLGTGAVCATADSGGSLGLPEWFDEVRVSGNACCYPYGAYWAYESTFAPESVLRARAARALRRLNDARAQERIRALRELRPIVGVIPLPEGLAAIERVWRTDPHSESLMRKETKTSPLVPTKVYTVREAAGLVLTLLRNRIAWEKWLGKQPPGKQAENAVNALMGGRYPRGDQPKYDDLIVVWLVRHSAESLPILTKVESGRPSLGSNGVIPTVQTPNARARIAAATVIGANKARRYAPYLLSLLHDPTCFVSTTAQRLPPTVGGKIEPRNLYRSYPVRDTAAGALQALGYTVTFDGKRYHARPPANRDSAQGK